MGSHQVTAGCDTANNSRQLDRRCFNGSLTNRHIESFVRVPAIVVSLHLPLRAGHQAGLLAGKIDAGFLPVTEFRGVLCNPVDSQPVSQLVIVGIAGEGNRVMNIDSTVMFVAVVEETVRPPSTGAVYFEVLCDSLL